MGTKTLGAGQVGAPIFEVFFEEGGYGRHLPQALAQVMTALGGGRRGGGKIKNLKAW